MELRSRGFRFASPTAIGVSPQARLNLLVWGGALHLVGDFQDGEVQLDGRLGGGGGELVANHGCEAVSDLGERRGLFGTAVLAALARLGRITLQLENQWLNLLPELVGNFPRFDF